MGRSCRANHSAPTALALTSRLHNYGLRAPMLQLTFRECFWLGVFSRHFENLLMSFQYQTGYLSYDLHQVLIRANCSTETPLLLDYVDVRTYLRISSASTMLVPSRTATSTETLSVVLLPYLNQAHLLRRTSATQSPTPIAAIAGGVLGGLALIAVAVTCAFFLLRRRFRRTRFTFVGEDGIDGGQSPTHPEEDMPPPDYQHVFARGSEAMRPHAFARGRQRNLSPAPLETSEIQHHLADIAEPATARHPPLPRPGTDLSLLAWKGQLPIDNHKKNSKLGGFHWRSGQSQK
jgi:hypothetical protein